jgi:hypothetical protein
VEELGNVFTDLPEYDELLEEATSTARERLSQQEAGRMLLARGIQKLRANRPYEAIVYFGRAQQSLAMRESRWEIASPCSCAAPPMNKEVFSGLRELTSSSQA